MENPYNFSDNSSPSRKHEDPREKILQEAAEAGKNDPEIKKEIDKANKE